MGRKLDIGDVVICRLFNWPEGRSYGGSYLARIISVDPTTNEKMPYHTLGQTLPDARGHWLARREIQRRWR